MRKPEASSSVLTVRRLGVYPRLERFLATLLRFAVAWAATFGLCSLVNQGLELGHAAAFLGISFLYTALFFLALTSLRLAMVGGGLMLVSFVVVSKACGLSLWHFFLGAGIGLWNRIMLRMAAFGYLTAPMGSERYVSQMGIVVLVSFLSAFVFSLFLRRRTRSLPLLAVFLAVGIPFYVSGMLTSFSALLLPLCAICGAVAMRRSEVWDRELSSSGATGLMALLLALALLLSPIGTSVGKPMLLSPLSERLQAWIEELLDLGEVDLPSGDMPSFDPLSAEDKRSAKAYDRRYEDEQLLRVESDRGEATYLRTWVGGKYIDDAWEVVDYKSYDISYGEYALTVPPYQLTMDFFHAYAGMGKESLSDVLASVGYRSRRFKISLKNSETLFPLPIGSVSGPFGGAVSIGASRYDGILTNPKGKTKQYYIDTWSRVSATEEELSLLRELSLGYRQYLSRPQTDLLPYDANLYAKKLMDFYGEYGLLQEKDRFLNYPVFLHSAYGATPYDSAIDRAVMEIFETTDIGRYFDSMILQTYPPKGEASPSEVRYILREDANLHEIAEAVADYLAENCRYTLTPGSDRTQSAMWNFLFVTKEGYCVQFATAGALILRHLGFLTRYAEGYVVDQFLPSSSSDSYVATVYDRQAHAWCEVWMDGVGWIPFEMTPGYGEVLPVEPPVVTTDEDPIVTTEPPSITTDEDPFVTTEPQLPPTITTDEDPTVTIEPPTTTSGEGGEMAEGQDLRPLLTVILLLTPIVVVLVVISCWEDKRKRRQKALVARVAAVGHASHAERKALGEQLTGELSKVLGAYRLQPHRGELPDAFGKRLDKELASLGLEGLLSSAISATVSQVYGGEMSAEELKVALDALFALRKKARKSLPLSRYLLYRLRGIL